MIGIGLTTFGNRITPALEMIRKYSDRDSRIVTIAKQGISEAKNACLALLDDCDDIFLFDDDCYPKWHGWEDPYMLSGWMHLSYTFNRKIVEKAKGITKYELPSGCMIYLRREVLDVVGGFDTEYKGYGYEHVDFSQRIFNAGLTEYPFADITNSNMFIHSMDEHKEVKTTVPNNIRAKNIPLNRKRLEDNKNSKEYKPYK